MKLDLAREIMVNSVRGGKPLNALECFTMAEDFESVAVKKGLWVPDNCKRCGSKVAIIDLSTGQNKQYRVQCDCFKVNAKTTLEGLELFWKETNV